jgi:signal transduction histidine kinase/FixJ family two-component response regulator/putative methionine-R-sulfoxide reductase with GAF domain
MAAKSERIVIIDDEKRMCDSLSALLAGEGYQVAAFQRSPQAVEAIRNEKVDLVITDIKMPDMDGLVVLQLVKEIDEGIPVILLTGNASLESAIDAVGRGAYDYLVKPIEFDRLETVVGHAIDRRRSELARLRLVEELRLSNLILQRRVGELNALYEAGKSIGSSVNLNELLRQIVVLASSVTEANVGSIMLLDEQKEYLTIEAAIGLSDDIVIKTRLPIGASIAGYVAKTGEALIVEDVEKDQRFKRINRERYGAASLLCTPLRIKNNILGVINMANKGDGKGFTPDDLRLLTTFASQAAVAVDDAYQFEGSRRRLVEFEILHEITGELHTIDSLTSFRNALTEKLRRVFPVDYAVWFEWDPMNRCLVAGGAQGRTGIPLTDSGKIDLSKVSRDAISITDIDLESFDVNDITKLSRFLGEKLKKNKHLPQPKEAYMAVPITRNGELSHVFYLGADSERAYSDDDISLARLVISQAAVLFERERALLNATRLLTMGNMISEISHDLRRPLTSIKGGLQILRQRSPEIVANSEFFSTAEEEIRRMNELVRELVDFSNPNKYETGKVDLRQVVRRASELVGPDLKNHGVSFSADFDDANWEVILSKNQIMEVFLNLFINAIDAMSEGGSLAVRGLVERPPHRSEDYLAVKVIDSGVGISKENLSRVFDRYYTTKTTGTGLGLAVVERVVSAHNGTIHIDSAVDKGTTVTIYLPYAP